MSEGRRDAVTVLDGEVEGAAAGRVAVGDDKTVKTKLNLVRSRPEIVAAVYIFIIKAFNESFVIISQFQTRYSQVTLLI